MNVFSTRLVHIHTKNLVSRKTTFVSKLPDISKAVPRNRSIRKRVSTKTNH